jgi:hypothetical protein
MISNSYGNAATEPYQDLKLFETHVEVTLNHVTKCIALPEFKKVLDELLQDTTPLANLALPYNTFTIGQNSSELCLSCYYPETKKEITYQARGTNIDEKFTVPFPNTVISHKLKAHGKGWQVTDTKYFATDLTVVKIPETQAFFTVGSVKGLHVMPFPNFYDYATMCYGNNTMPMIHTNNLRGLDYFYQILFIAPFNDDLGLRGVSSRNASSVRTWFQHLATLDKFPYKELRGYSN